MHGTFASNRQYFKKVFSNHYKGKIRQTLPLIKSRLTLLHNTSTRWHLSHSHTPWDIHSFSTFMKIFLFQLCHFLSKDAIYYYYYFHSVVTYCVTFVFLKIELNAYITAIFLQTCKICDLHGSSLSINYWTRHIFLVCQHCLYPHFSFRFFQLLLKYKRNDNNPSVLAAISLGRYVARVAQVKRITSRLVFNWTVALTKRLENLLNNVIVQSQFCDRE